MRIGLHRGLVLALFVFAMAHTASAQEERFALEAESPDTRIEWRGDTAEIWSPKGMTLWLRQPLTGDSVVIEYDAEVILNDSADRLSDLNCFWMATDPAQSDGSVLAGMDERQGVFVRCYGLQLYYVGFGGNYNTTTRFRRYDGKQKPPVLKEYTDADHLLKANHWYHIRLEQIDGRVRYLIDGECLVDYSDSQPYNRGWFGFRSTLSHTRFHLMSVNGLCSCCSGGCCSRSQ